MKLLPLSAIILLLASCNNYNDYAKKVSKDNNTLNVLFLHHSTGNNIFKGMEIDKKPEMMSMVESFNKSAKNKINFVEQAFPKSRIKKFIPGYGWYNYPYDYYNIWVKNSDKNFYKGEPTLKTLSKDWNVIILKHCFPVSSVINDNKKGDINSDKKTLANYKLQYNALKKEFKKYPDIKFIIWTGAALTQASTNEESAKAADEFFNWVKNSWDSPNDNIYLWDFRKLETEGGLYLKDEYASSKTDSHPNKAFSSKAVKLFFNRLSDIIINNGKNTETDGSLLNKE